MTWRWNGNSETMLRTVSRAEIGGKRCKSVKQLPGAVFLRLPRLLQSIAVLCVELDLALAALSLSDCQKIVLSLTRDLCENFSPVSNSARQAFLTFGGDALLLRVLLCPFNGLEQESKKGTSVAKVWMLRKDCVDILRELCAAVPHFSESLAAHRDYLPTCFSLMESAITFDSAVHFAEEILVVRDEMLDLREIENFVNLVDKFSARQLVLFCRVLAMVVFEPESPKVVTGEELEDGTETESGCSVADFNLEVILAIPSILSRLVKLLYHYMLPATSRVRTSPDGMHQRDYGFVDMIWRDGLGAFEASLQDTSRLLEGNGNLTGSHVEAEVDSGFVNSVDVDALISIPVPEILNVSNQVEILFVLSCLCGSSKRNQVQNTFAKLGLVEILSHMFDRIDWGASQDSAKPRGIHGQGCSCNPPSALKIQYLRLVHNFCDRESCNKANKNLLLKPTLHLFKGIESLRAKHKACDGLMIKIVKVFIHEPADSMFRFWMASCLETFLRGADLKDQLTLASTGLMEHLLAEILKGGFCCSSSSQINFDLLGELIKFNHILFARFSNMLDDGKFTKFVKVLVTNLVDSNVFIRSVMLSMEGFWVSSGQVLCKGHMQLGMNDGTKSRCNGAMDNLSFLHGSDDHWYQIGTFIALNGVQLLVDLMSAVPLGDVNQDNVCAINTALIMFILAERKGVLQNFLQILNSKELLEGTTRGGHTLQRFRHLLKFWRIYYLRKTTRDSFSLEYSTKIPFEEWIRVANLLCKDGEQLTSLSSFPGCKSGVMAISACSESSSRRG